MRQLGQQLYLLLLLSSVNIIIMINTSSVWQDEFAGQCQRCDGVLVHKGRKAACNSS